VSDTLHRVPAHLRRFVVQQDYAAYTAVDQAVWRFVLLQMFDRLQTSAHPAYARGLLQTGMSVERIPRISEMDECLHEFGWGAVCVDGFIPPRAFQEFQALGFLPIAADMRRLENLAYTPAPDIIHEAAGHAPFLADAEYAKFLRRIGECGVRAFASRRDAALYEAVRELSIAKEERNADPARALGAEQALGELAASGEASSEATRLARLYWWTVEYGLVGSPSDYRLFGAGLLSSLFESHFCHDPAVRKLPLDPSCVELDYDITRPQPQLFVAANFAHLTEVLEQVCEQFAFRSGGLRGLLTAQAAAELATIELDSGVQATGSVAAVFCDDDQPRLIVLQGECALGADGQIFAGQHRDVYRDGMLIALGQFADAGEFLQSSFDAQRSRGSDGRRVRIEMGAGLAVVGCVCDVVAQAGNELRAVVLRQARALRGSELLWSPADGMAVIARGGRVRGVRAGAQDPSYWPAQGYSELRVPRAEPESDLQFELRQLYEREACARAMPTAVAELVSIHERLQGRHGEEWLLRWNLLDRLSRLGEQEALRRSLAETLQRLELHFERRYPIATGLAYLGYGDRR
jgi:phenylalanine-4-hydroxylase